MSEEHTIDPRRQADWEDRYQQGNTGWDQGAPSAALDHWLQAMPAGRVLVPGCGHGHEIAVLARAGHQVTAVDIAPTPVAGLRQGLAQAGLQAEVLQADLLHWEPAEPFDAIYEQTCLCALDPSHWQEYQERLCRWLKPGGQLFVLFMQTGSAGGPPFDCPMPQMQQLFDQEHWSWVGDEALELVRPNGNRELGYVLQRI